MKRKQSQKYLRKRIAATGLSAVLAGSTIVGMLPANVYAVTGSQVAKDGTYTNGDATVDVSNVNDNESTYKPSVSVTVKDGKFTDVSLQSNSNDEDNQEYFEYVMNGRRNKPGLKSQIIGKTATAETIAAVDARSGATIASTAVKNDLQYALANALAAESSDTPDIPAEDKTFEIDAYSGNTMQDLYQNNKFDMDSAAIWKFTTISKYVGGSSASTQDFVFPTTVKEIQGYDGLTKHQTQLNPYYYNYGHNVIFQSGCNTTVTGIDFESDNNPFGGDPNSVDVMVKSGANVTFKNCTFKGKLTVEDGAIVNYDNCKFPYNVSFDANEGSGAPSALTGTDSSVTFPDTVPTREGYIFEGYATSKDATAAQYKAGDTIKITPDDKNLTLYAVWKEVSEPAADEGYVLMNIPYDKFYEGEGTDLKADVVTSATKQKSRSNTIVCGSYHEKSDGSEIDGVTFPVKVSDLSKLTGTEVTDNTTVSVTTTVRGKESTDEYKGREALFENSSYAYYVLPSDETPSYYKELTVNADGSYSFGKTKTTQPVNTVNENDAELDSGVEARHGGDYEIKLNDYANTLKQNNVSKVYGVIMHTQENEDYAFRHLENIWTPQSGEFGFSVGHTTVGGHESPVSFKNFESAEGKTVTGFTVYTDKGVDEINLNNPMKLVRFAAENVKVSAADDHTISIANIPSDAENVTASVSYEKAGDNGRTSKEYLTDKENPTKVENGKLVLPEGKTLEDGTTYTVRVYSSNYATEEAEFKKSSSHSGGGSTVTPTPTPTPAPSKLKFTDVSEKAYYHDAVQWAVDNKVTTGTTETTFSPNEYCTRGQMIQFLYNLAGKPEVSGTTPFTDVSTDAFYHDAVVWAYQNGITAGTSATTFSPNEYCSRSYMVQFLYSRAGKPAVSGTMPFDDVKTGKYYYNAVLWAYQKGITAGTTATAFSPNENCTRGQMVQFLYKASKI